MRGEAQFNLAELALVLGTRAAVFVGTGLLIADSFSSSETRTAVGRTLLVAGLFAGTCLAAEIFGSPRSFSLAFGKHERAADANRVTDANYESRPRGRQQGSMAVN